MLTSENEVSWCAGFSHTAISTAGAVPDNMHWAVTPNAITIGQKTILNHAMLEMKHEGGHTRLRIRIRLHLFQPHQADQMPGSL